MKRKRATLPAKEGVLLLLQRQKHSAKHEENCGELASHVIDVDNDDIEVTKTLYQNQIVPTTTVDVTSAVQDSQMSLPHSGISPTMLIDIPAENEVGEQKFAKGTSCTDQPASSKDVLIQTKLEAIEQNNNILWNIYEENIH